MCDKEHFLIPYAFIPTSISVHKTAMNSQDARHFKTFSKGETHCARKKKFVMETFNQRSQYSTDKLSHRIRVSKLAIEKD